MPAAESRPECESEVKLVSATGIESIPVSPQPSLDEPPVAVRVITLRDQRIAILCGSVLTAHSLLRATPLQREGLE
jgi:hypothetical protein